MALTLPKRLVKPCLGPVQKLDIELEAMSLLGRQGVPLSEDILSAVLKGIKDMEAGKRVHSLFVRIGLDSNAFLMDHLIRFFACSGKLYEANQSFGKVAEPSVYTWTAIISANATLGQGDMAFKLWQRMQLLMAECNRYSYLAVLRACVITTALTQGRFIHGMIIESGLESNVIVGSALIDMYSKSNSLDEARKVFDSLPIKNIVSWSTMISGHAENGCGVLALEYFSRMQQEGIAPERVAFLGSLKGCTIVCALEMGRLIHNQVLDGTLHSDIVIGSMLVDMYAKCGSLEEACMVFSKLPNQDIIAWSAIIAAHVHHGYGLSALELFDKMQREGIKPDLIVFVNILKACSNVGAIEQGKLIHKQIIDAGFESDISIASNLIEMYAKCGDLDGSQRVFDRLPNQTVLSCSAMISGYIQHDQIITALELFERMEKESGIIPDMVSLLNMLKLYASKGALENGRVIHDRLINSGLDLNVVVKSSLVDMYAKCGNLEEAQQLFGSLPERNVVSWNAMIAGCVQYENAGLCARYFQDMQQQGNKPNDATFLSVLAACCHAGLVDEGNYYFRDMRKSYGVTAVVSHITCMIDLLGRAGRFNEAETFLKLVQPDFFSWKSVLTRKPCEIVPRKGCIAPLGQYDQPDIVAWKSLLTACRTYSNMELGRQCFDHLICLDPHDASVYVLMSNIYANANMWEESLKVDELRKCAGAWKKAGKAWIEVNKKLHEFTVGDKSHPQSNEIYAMLKKLNSQMKEEGYIPQVDIVLRRLSEKDKEETLCGHCEKLAIAFGLISTPQGTTIRVSKNLRVCTDCHIATKVISKIEMREIIIKDAYRLHHFRDGLCSCGDYF